ncbi:PAAR domain-containing protein [Sulfurivirga sp.]|uniref:PAAR domain-containing protein n=1 Tax=Sulfurivirga sp. TaxID=2614236 RepID=UPI0025D5627C|nr:PAAR domain-containing protein [Sulfurivirga sp.]
MPAVARLGDSCTGHGCYPPRENTGASSDVFINGRGAHRAGDGWASHCCGPPCHGGSLAAGSSSVFVNGRALGRVGDPVDCGSAVATGSPDVFAGG